MSALPVFQPPDWELGAPFWAAVQRGELVLPRCSRCGRWQWYPDHGGTDCSGGELAWTPVAQTGTVYAMTRVHRSFLPKAGDAAPYLVGLVDLDGIEGGTRLVANLDDVAGMAVGARVQLRVEHIGGRAHPVFELARPGPGGVVTL